MKPGKSPVVEAPSLDDVVCYGTAFVARSDQDWVNVEKPVPAERPQFGSAFLDMSFLSNCLIILVGTKSHADGNWTDAIKQVGITDHRSSTAVHIYACSAPFCDVLAALTEEQEDQIAQEWYRLLRARQEEALQKMRGPRLDSAAGKHKAKGEHHDSRVGPRVTLVKQLVALARQAKVGNQKLMLRVECRRRGNLI
jgi:hypothetical protein